MAMINFIFSAILKHHGWLVIYAQDKNPDSEPIENNPIGVALMITIICIYLIVSDLFAYTILEVVAVLTMVEKGSTPFVVGEADEPLLATENADPSGPITLGIRKTLKYLHGEAGVLSALRGLGYYFIYGFSEGFLNGMFVSIFRPLLWVFADIFVPVPVALLVWALNNAWLHKVISKPSQKPWWSRYGEQSRARSVLPAISLWAFCRSASTFVIQMLANIFVLSKFTVVENEIHFADDASPRDTLLEAIGIYALNLLLLLLLVVPAKIILVRVQASILPDNDEVIVPFDKTFNGKLVSESMEGHNQLAMLDAWHSFEWPGRIRLLKIYAKYFVVQITLALLGAGLSLVAVVFSSV